MVSSSRRTFWWSVSFGLFFLLANPVFAADKTNEIVRVSYVQGDVRFSRGNGKTPDLNKDWGEATVNLPVLRGDSVATGEGRAEIEFENGSTLYLAENSVLLFDRLEVRNGFPDTVVELLTGTATFHVQPVPGEMFRVDTPSGGGYFQDRSYVRIDSFLDGIVVSPIEAEGDTVHQAGGGAQHIPKGESVAYQNGHLERILTAKLATAAGDWDTWVDARVKEQMAATSAGLAESGLAAPIPGLADLHRDGQFFACGPFGRCWAPNGEMEAGTLQDQEGAAKAAQQQGSAATPQPQKPRVRSYYYPGLGCPQTDTRVDMVKDPVTGKERVVGITDESAPWNWALCHAGSWIRWRNRFVWVAGRKRHHPPIRWVRTGKTTGYVPRHPSDVKGRPPLNLRYGVLVLTGDAAKPIERVAYSASQPVKVLNEAPKEFRNQKPPELAHAEPPAIQARLLAEEFPRLPKNAGTTAAKDQFRGGPRPAIAYDYKTRQFERQAGTGQGADKTVVLGRYSAGNGFSAGGSGGIRASGGGYRGTASGGSARVGGGGAASGGGGGSHGGGSSAGASGGHRG